MQYMSPLVFSALGLIDPAITAMISWSIGVEGLPAWFSWLGGGFVMVGIGIISYGEFQREQKKNEE